MLASASLDGAVSLWQTENGQRLQTFTRQSIIEGVVFSADGESLVIAERADWDSDGRLVWLDPADGSVQQVRESAYTGAINNLALSPDGQTLGAGTWRKLYFWRFTDGSLVQAIDHGNESTYLAWWGTDNQTVASATSQLTGKIDVWDLTTGDHVRTIDTTNSPVLLWREMPFLLRMGSKCNEHTSSLPDRLYCETLGRVLYFRHYRRLISMSAKLSYWNMTDSSFTRNRIEIRSLKYEFYTLTV